MEDRMEHMVCVDELQLVSLRLGKLNSMITSICLGMQQENIAQQAVDCVESIGYCVNDIRNIVVDVLKQLEELQRRQEEKGKLC